MDNNSNISFFSSFVMHKINQLKCVKYAAYMRMYICSYNNKTLGMVKLITVLDKLNVILPSQLLLHAYCTHYSTYVSKHYT